MAGSLFYLIFSYMWKPVITDPVLKQAISNKLEQLFEAVKQVEDNNCGLLGGHPGPILFTSYYFRHDPSKISDYNWNIEMLYDYFQNPGSLNYSTGMAGILYTLNHLQQEELFDFGDDLQTFDYSIFNDYILKEPTLDFLHGSSGVIHSLLEQDAIKDHRPFMQQWLSAIERTRETSDDELKWKIDFKYKDRIDKGYSIGLAHGLPSVILILLKWYQKQPDPATLSLIQQGLRFILSWKNEDTSRFYFPSRITNGQRSGGRLAWCYGDLGIAMMLYACGRDLNDKALTDLAIEIFRKHTSIHDYKFYDVDDADFCHGSVGIAHIYARMYNATAIEAFRETAEYWYRTTLEKAIYPDGLTGYKHSYGADHGMANVYGMLEGITGIGLSFISAISSVEPKWDKALLVS